MVNNRTRRRGQLKEYQRFHLGQGIPFFSLTEVISTEAVVRRYSVKKVFLKFRKTHRKASGLSFNNVVALRPTTLLKKRLRHRHFPMNFAKLLRTPFITDHLRWLLLPAVCWSTSVSKMTLSLRDNRVKTVVSLPEQTSSIYVGYIKHDTGRFGFFLIRSEFFS